MDDDAIRQKLTEKFRANQLHRALPNALSPSTLEGFEAMSINTGRGKRCSVCDEMIGLSDVLPRQYTYCQGESYAFHQRCEELWQAERQKPILQPRDQGA